MSFTTLQESEFYGIRRDRAESRTSVHSIKTARIPRSVTRITKSREDASRVARHTPFAPPATTNLPRTRQGSDISLPPLVLPSKRVVSRLSKFNSIPRVEGSDGPAISYRPTCDDAISTFVPFVREEYRYLRPRLIDSSITVMADGTRSCNTRATFHFHFLCPHY